MHSLLHRESYLLCLYEFSKSRVFKITTDCYSSTPVPGSLPVFSSIWISIGSKEGEKIVSMFDEQALLDSWVQKRRDMH